jgi:hypothetical protein
MSLSSQPLPDDRQGLEGRARVSQQTESRPADGTESLPADRQYRADRTRLSIDDNATYLSSLVEQDSYFLLHLFGYGLFALALADFFHLLVPLHLMQPNWEFQTMGQFVEHVPVPLISLVLIFIRRAGSVRKLELRVLKVLSRTALALGLLYLLMSPLILVDAWKIYHQTETRLEAQISQQTEPLQRVKDRLSQAKSDSEILAVLSELSPEANLDGLENVREIKEQTLSEVTSTEEKLRAEAASYQSNQKFELMKDSTKWIFGALVSGSLFIWLWRKTLWARLDY